MNKKQVLDFLLQYLSNILKHPNLIEELLSGIARSGFEDRFRNILLKQLRILSVMGIQATDTAEFERLDDGLYSMHISGKGFNYRILYFFLPNGQPALLHSFEEREGKNKTDYSSHLPVALDRKKEMEEEYRNGR